MPEILTFARQKPKHERAMESFGCRDDSEKRANARERLSPEKNKNKTESNVVVVAVKLEKHPTACRPEDDDSVEQIRGMKQTTNCEGTERTLRGQ